MSSSFSLSKLLTRTPLSANFSLKTPKAGPEYEPLVQEDSKAIGDSAKCELRIEGMTCGSCVESIEGMLRDQDGIHSIKVALLAERGVVEFDPEKWSAEKIISEISDVGFDASLIPTSRSDSVTIKIYGMTCSVCTGAVERRLQSAPGIISVAVSESIGSANVDFDRTLINVREIIEAIQETGFHAMLSDQEDATQLRSLQRVKEINEWWNRFMWSLTFAVPVFLLSMVFPHIGFMKPFLHYKVADGICICSLLLFLLTTPVQFWLGQKFYKSAWKSIKHGSATMDILIVIGTTAAYTFSVFSLFLAPLNPDPDYEPPLFFDTTTMLIMFVSLGRYLENRAKGKTSAALTDLMSLSPSMATIYTDPECTKEKKVATELLQPGDIIKMVPGEKVPADGTVVKGSSSIDESAVTGEPVPVIKQLGDSVIGGTLNGLGTFDMKVVHAGKDTALAQIVKLVEDAQTSKAPIQAFADRVAGYFIPAVLSLSALTFVAWIIVSYVVADDSLPDIFTHHNASKLAVCLKLCISVVVVACPCALGLSTPTAIMVGTGVGAKNGILIKGGRALEASRSIKHIVFDKTGTITEGKLQVVGLSWVASDLEKDVYADSIKTPALFESVPLSSTCADGVTSRAAVIAMVAATEARSEHPLAKAVATYGKELLSSSPSQGTAIPEVNIDAFESVTGLGVEATMTLKGTAGPYKMRIGTSRFVSKDEEGRVHPSMLEFYDKESELGRTVIFVSITHAPSLLPLPILAISLSDIPKASSKRAVQSLNAMGIEVYMMTGDGHTTALAIAKEVGIPGSNVWASMSPKGKATRVTELMEKYAANGGGVAMVGDGINDSPALVAASVGIALSSGTSIAVEAADIVLMRSDLLDVVASINLSCSIYATIRRNLVWACVYNILMIPLAMGFFLPLGLHLHPMMAGAAMAFSSVSVVTSSLLLRWWRRPASSVMPGEKVPGETMIQSARAVFSDAWGSVRAVVNRRPTEGYRQIPVEMNESV